VGAIGFALGVLLLGLCGGILLYGPWLEFQHQAQRPAHAAEVVAAVATIPDDAADEAGAEPSRDRVERAVWIEIPRIGVDARVIEVSVQGGEYQVPSFDVGHHADSANPGELGNSVFNGHLHTIDAGRVFAMLDELAQGDVVHVYTPGYRFDWVVREVRTVPNTDHSFIRPTLEPRLTLYTCAGAFDLRTRDYTHRQVVVAALAQVVPRTKPPGTHS
jgi:LPXTG-site transpeptidase (sortase) family protein